MIGIGIVGGRALEQAAGVDSIEVDGCVGGGQAGSTGSLRRNAAFAGRSAVRLHSYA